MWYPGSVAWSRSRARLARIAAADVDDETLRLEVVAALRASIGFDAWGWPLADPVSLLPTTGIADAAMWPVVPRIVEHEERAADVNKDLDLATRGDPVGVLSTATRGDLARSSRWRDILGPHGFGDELRVACVDRHGCWGHLRLYRDSSSRPFTAADADGVREVVPAIASALRRQAARVVPAPSQEPLGPAIVILDHDLGVRSWTSGAGAWFDSFAGARPPRGANARCAVLSAAARCLNGNDDARARLRLHDGRWVVAEAARLDGAGGEAVVSVRSATTDETLDIVGRVHGLTPRERELVALVVDGLDTAALAARLGIARYTVQQHFKSVFDKVGVRSRRELVTGIFGRPQSLDPSV
jgi:DNA-binding CsgD family transcriptional regulator